jgi:hypothetical protein
MAIINHSVEQLTGPGYWTKFEGLDRIKITVTVPNWHEPFPSRQRAGAANPRELELVGLLHVCQTWYINGPVMDQWTISTLEGPIKVPAGTRIVSELLPGKWAAWEQEASEGTR